MLYTPLGSTEKNALLGTNSFSGPHEVFNRRAMPTPDDDKPHLREGRIIEQYIIDESWAAFDKRWLVTLGMDPEVAKGAVTKPIKSHFRELPFGDGQICPTRATPDGRVVASNRHQKPLMIIEAKSAFYGDTALWSDHLGKFEEGPVVESTIPAGYYDQCQDHMWHTDTFICLVPVRFNFTSAAKMYWVRRNDARIAELAQACLDFWRDHILTGLPPAPDASKGMRLYLAMQEATNAEFQPAEDKDYDLMRKFYALRNQQKHVEESLDATANEMKERVVKHGGWGVEYDGEFTGRLHYKPNKNGKRSFSTKGVKHVESIDY